MAVYSALQSAKKDLRKRIVALSFLYYGYRKSVFLKLHNILENPQILQHEFLISLQQPKTAPGESRYPIFVALERGLNVSHLANIQPAVIESQI